MTVDFCGICGLPTITERSVTYCSICYKLLCASCRRLGHQHNFGEPPDAYPIEPSDLEESKKYVTAED